MKKILLLIVLALITQTIKAQTDAFITTWVTTTGFETLTLTAQADAPNYTINWGDGFSNTYTATQVPTHTYFNSGEHTLSFTGIFPHLTFSGQTKLKAVQQWGTQKWTSMANMFRFCSTFNSFPTQAPDLSLCTDMSSIFQSATAFNQPIGSWNVSNVTNMDSMFSSASAFNQSVDSWNVSNVTNMTRMFYSASTFNQPIGSWNVSSVTDMTWMFSSASAFNQPIGSWNVSNVTKMPFMFSYTSTFNQPISNWNVSKVTDMTAMFSGTKDFNQPIGPWDVSNVINMTGLFQDAFAFNQPIGTWNVGSVELMSFMFIRATSFNQTISSWDVSKVKNMIHMFSSTVDFNQPIDSWDISNVINMNWMFENASDFNQSIGSWKVNNVTSMYRMFNGTKLSNDNYDATLIGWATIGTNGGVLKSGVTFSGGNSNYCNALGARDYLINTYGWVITDGGLKCNSLETEVVIGTQTWTDKNLDVATYSDGTLIPQVTDPTEWATLTTGAWCYYDNDYANGTTFGKLYNWYAVAGIHDTDSNTPNKTLAPTGYHVPSDAEWTNLSDYLGGEIIAGNKMRETGIVHWTSPNLNATNSSGFTGIPGGYRDFTGIFDFIGDAGVWWSNTEITAQSAWYRDLLYNDADVTRRNLNKTHGYSVRCVKDNALSNKKFEDNTFKIYPNPVINTITVDCGNLSNLINQPFVIMDALGKIILKGKLNEGNTTINVEHLSKGIYFIKVANDKASKFIKE